MDCQYDTLAERVRLNGRLVADGKWEPTTSFDTALGPMAGQVGLLSLRTNKADPMYVI